MHRPPSAVSCTCGGPPHACTSRQGRVFLCYPPLHHSSASCANSLATSASAASMRSARRRAKSAASPKSERTLPAERRYEEKMIDVATRGLVLHELLCTLNGLFLLAAPRVALAVCASALFLEAHLATSF